ncbi:MAG: VCBS repeat-containing protein [Candidatus Thermoplasmatota archaeon]
MLRALAVAALLALALPAEARPFVLADEPATATAGDLPEARIGSPLVRSQVDAWMPILKSDGYAAAAQAMSQPESEPASSDDDRIEHWFMPLGDANGNGRDDVVLATSEKDTITYKALDGGRVGEVLWTLEIEDDDYAYLAGDVDEDGVYDIERLAEGEETSSDDGMQWEQRSTVTILSGRDLAPLTELQLVSRGSYERTEPELVLIGESTWKDRYSFEYVTDLDGQPGMARITWTWESYESEERFVFLTTASSSTYNYSSTITVLDVAGALRWAHDEPGWDFAYGGADVTGDEVPDLLMRSGDSYGYSSSGFLPPPPVDPPVDPPLPFQVFGSEEETQAPHQVRLLDGASGGVLWEQTFANASYSYTEWLGDLHGNGPVLAVITFDFTLDEDHEYSMTAQTSLVDGATGDILRQEPEALSFAPLGDANGDGKDDLLSLDFNDSTLTFVASDGDLNVLWDLKLSDDDFAGMSDLDADGVLDLLAWHGDNLTVYSGTDGKKAWAREEPRWKDYDLTPGIVSKDRREVAVLLSDALDHEAVTDYKADMLVLRGSDGASVWRKPLYDPADYLDVSDEDIWLWVDYAGDLNGDGARDFIVNLEQGFDIMICDGDGCEEISSEEDEDTGQRLSITLLVDGATGSTITRFDDMDLAKKVKKVEEAPVDVKPAAEEIREEVSGENAPGFALYAALAAVGVALAIRRRKA